MESRNANSSAASRVAALRHDRSAPALDDALLVVAAYITSVGGSETHIYSATNDFDRGLHELVGMSVFALTLVRMGWRAIVPPPKSAEMPAWMQFGSKIGHWTIYLLLLLVPLTAVFGACLEGHPLTLLGLAVIQPWVVQSRQFGLDLADIHGWLGNALVWFAGAHAIVALYYHF